MSEPERLNREQVWRARVEAWKQSGESISAFAAHEKVSASSLRRWIHAHEKPSIPRFFRVVPATARPAAVPVRGLVVTIGDARIQVETGFDPLLLQQIVRALSSEAR